MDTQVEKYYKLNNSLKEALSGIPKEYIVSLVSEALELAEEYGVRRAASPGKGKIRGGYLLRSDNKKIEKRVGHQPYHGVGMSLLPHTLGGKAHEATCALAALLRLDCRAKCLNTSGNSRYKDVQTVRGRRKRFVVQEPDMALATLFHDITVLRKQAARKDKTLCVRLNVVSDLPWWEILPKWFFESFSDVQFYDYTKERQWAYDYLAGRLPENYSLTWSWHEGYEDTDYLDFLRAGGNVAIIMPVSGAPNAKKKDLPVSWHGYPIIDGDTHDLRFLDPTGCVIGLRLKQPLKLADIGVVGHVMTPDYPGLAWG